MHAWKYPKAVRPPALVNAYRRKRPAQPPPAVKNVSNAPFGIQQSTYLKVLDENGVDGRSFIDPLQKLTFNYCDIGGSSKGIREFILTRLSAFAKKHPQFEIIVQPRPYRHPVIRAEYGIFISRISGIFFQRHLLTQDNGFRKEACARGMGIEEIMSKVDLFKNSAGISPIKPKAPVLSQTPSIRGIWTPFKDPKPRLTHKPQAPQHLYSNN